jgi:hypothetical protein
LPGLDFVEELKEKNTEEQIGFIIRQIISVDHIPNKELAYPVGRAICVRKFEASQDGVIGQWTTCPLQSTIKDSLPFGREPPISVEHLRRSDLTTGNGDSFTFLGIKTNIKRVHAEREIFLRIHGHMKPYQIQA